MAVDIDPVAQDMDKFTESANRFVAWCRTPFGADVCIFVAGLVTGILIAS